MIAGANGEGGNVGSDFDLTGKVVLVTGGNSGIGLGMAEGLARAGADVCIWGRNAARNDEARRRIAEHGARAHAIACDVSDPEQIEAAFAETLRELGKIDSCFANAGTPPLGNRFVDLTLEEFRAILAVNLDGAFLTLQGAARDMVARDEGGSLVGIASLAALSGQPRGQHYAASKGGVIAMINSCAVELARYGIRANSILPGWIESAMTDEMLASQPMLDRVLPRVPARRWGKPDDFAGIAVYLASDVSSYHSGDSFLIDGGYRVF
jgi:NAD(P)-dependent dehydrogenase (short-subunit alcohol dehydrogenase family)